MRAPALVSVALAPLLAVVGLPASAAIPQRQPMPPSYSAARSHPLRDPYYPKVGTTSLDALHYGLDLTWAADTKTLSGTETVDFRATRDESSVDLDLASDLALSSVSLDGSVVTDTRHGHDVLIAAGPLSRDSAHTLTLTYSGQPGPIPAPTTRTDVPKLGWTVTKSGEVWTVQEPYGAYTWYAVNDHPSDKAYYDITWHTAVGWTGISNGKLVRDRKVGGDHVTSWHLANPAASYLVAAEIGPYSETKRTGPHGLPITFWTRADPGYTKRNLNRTPAMLRWLERLLGPYPFDRIGVVTAPTKTAEETQTLVTFGASVLKHPFAQSELVHELSHQWYGDDVTPNNWQDLWLNESFATYAEFRWDFHEGTPRHSVMKYLNKHDQRFRTKYGPPGEYDPKQFASINVYYCGVRMLFRLQQMVGAKTWAKVLRGWPRHEQFGSADRDDWIRFLDKTTGRHLDGFVHHWLDAKRTPI